MSGVAAISAGGVAAIILAAFWAVLVVFLCVVLLNVFRVLESTKELIDGVKDETVPLLGEVKTSVTKVNKELDRVDVIMESAGKMTKSAERVTGVVEQAVSSPLVKLIAFVAGASKAVKKFTGNSKR